MTPLLWPSHCVFLVLLMLGSTPSGFPKAPSVGCGLPYHIWSLAVRNSTGNCFLDPNSTELNNNSQRPLDLWNRMFNRHQAEITVTQFRGHSLPVHQSVLAQWDHSLNQPSRSLSITGHWNVSLPSGASPWNCIFWGAGSKFKTYIYIYIYN